MSKQEFIESVGATCKNWSWSWSYINEQAKTIIFGSWVHHRVGTTSLILGRDWQFNSGGVRKAGFTQALKHIRLIEEEGYQLKIFYMTAHDGDDYHPVKIKDFERELIPKKLFYINERWFAIDDSEKLPSDIEKIIRRPDK